MDDQMRLDMLTAGRKQGHMRLLALKSKTYRAFLDIERATYGDGALSRKHKELVAVGIAVVIGCEASMQWHIEQAAEARANREELLEAIEVGMEMGGSPAIVSVRFAITVIDGLFDS